jgi:hypothetical protein
MSEDERDTHFAGFANLHYPEISKLFFTMYARISELRPIEEIDALEDEIKKLIAQRAYDLVEHLYGSAGWDRNPWKLFEDAIRDLPDMTAWPARKESSNA